MTTWYIQGMDARGRGKSVNDNPHVAGTKEHTEWRNGFYAMDLKVREMVSNAQNMLTDIKSSYLNR